MTKKNSCGSKIPLPPHNFSNGPSLKAGLYGARSPCHDLTTKRSCGYSEPIGKLRKFLTTNIR